MSHQAPRHRTLGTRLPSPHPRLGSLLTDGDVLLGEKRDDPEDNVTLVLEPVRQRRLYFLGDLEYTRLRGRCRREAEELCHQYVVRPSLGHLNIPIVDGFEWPLRLTGNTLDRLPL